MEDEEDLVLRIGIFFLLIGAFLAILFIASDMAGQTDFDYLFLAMMLLGAGYMIRRRKKRPPPANRFAWLKKTRDGYRNRSKTDNKQQDKKR